MNINREHIHLKLTAFSSGGIVFTCFLGKWLEPWSSLLLLSAFPKPQPCSSWRFNPGSVRTSSGSKSPATQTEIESRYIKSMLHIKRHFLLIFIIAFTDLLGVCNYMSPHLFWLTNDKDRQSCNSVFSHTAKWNEAFLIPY